MPAMGRGQEAAWHALLDLYEIHSTDWTLIGGQLVHLHCAERGATPQRPTDDADMVVNARPVEVLGNVTSILLDMDFVPSRPSADGIQHRWQKGPALIDVLVPDGMGERAAHRKSVSGFRTIAAPGGTQALDRSQVVDVQVGARVGRLPRPSLIAALILKAKARINTSDSHRERHCDDFAVLASLLAAADMKGLDLSRGERKSLRAMIELTRANPRAMSLVPDVADRLERLRLVIGAG